MSITAISNQRLYTNYEQLSSGKRLNSSADDAAGLAIAEKLETQSNSYDIGRDNAATSQNMVNVADGALASISDSLQRMRELSLQASNTAIYGDSERNAMQEEINQLKNGISDIAKNTQFNTMNLLDGTLKDSHVAMNPDGSGMKIHMPDATLEALGIADYDVTKDFDISKLDDALNMISSARGELGATSSRLEYTMNYNSYASYNLTASRSRIEDLDYPKAISEKQKNEVLSLYKIMMQKKEMEQNGMVRLLQFP